VGSSTVGRQVHATLFEGAIARPWTRTSFFRC
jgi:hypothetical protein